MNPPQSNIEAARKCVGDAQTHSRRIEAIEDDLTGIDEEKENLDGRAESRRAERRRLEENVESLRQELEEATAEAATQREGDDVSDAKIRALMSDIDKSGRDMNGIHKTLQENKYEIIAAEKAISQCGERMADLQNVHRQRANKVREFKNGNIIYRAMEWLSNNRDKFRNTMYDPIVTLISVNDARYSVYLEHLISMRDLVAFGCAETSDVNLFINQTKRMELRVNVFHARSSNNPDEFKPKIPADKFDRKLQFKGYASDLFTAPAAIKEYCCRMFNLHNTPVFGQGAESYISDLTEKYKLRVFFVGQKRYTCIQSKYGGGITVSSNYMRRPKNWFTTGVDKARLAQLNKETEAKKTELGDLREQRTSLEAAVVEETQRQDDLKKKVTALKKKKEKVNIMGTRLRNKEQELRRFLATGSDDLGRQLREIREAIQWT